ncbi:BZ3500_MvSof-1268-A1-R1_Chr2-2g05114 [Microbotryum saponariae]|uniref:BZ3500_MvSof-1268-A1-R1_Chr2-2g05114 protein n=1 Tax=Microbotryum saponariae TaxID=289078 RepID=A0A2X0K8S1_9BASI|nr:BZ3500_MvSof-1268-A1-R1_Chr2-2g05114 [Microbotryum saponariae]SDA00941.1 BZ3501_MvSof-1269-A2-R1_Chr2-2g04788 [Microbotryum saponariae]
MSDGARDSTPCSSPASHSDDSEECHSDGSLVLVNKREDPPPLGAAAPLLATATQPRSRRLAPPVPSPIVTAQPGASAGLNPTSLQPGASAEPAPALGTSSLSPLSPSPTSTTEMVATTSFSSHTSVVHSGEAGVDMPARRALQDDSREVVGGPASGLYPEVVTKVTSSPVDTPTSGSSSSKPWYAKLATPLVGKHHGKSRRNNRELGEAEAGFESSDDEGDVGGDAGENDKKEQDVKAAEVLDEVDGRKEPSTPIHQSGSARRGLAPVAMPDRQLNPDTNDSPSMSESIKDRISEDHHPSPKVSNFKFHKLFASEIPDDDELIEDYRCALQKDVLVQGRLYLSEHYLAFKANILGWQTSVCIPFSEIVTIEKRMTALVIPNAIEVTTLNTRHVFASFLARDPAYDLLVDLWRHNHPGEERSRESKDQDSASIVSDAGGANGINRGGDVSSEISYEDEHGERKKHKFTNALAKVGSRLKSITAVNEDKPEGKTEAEKIKDKAKKDMQGDLGHEPTEYDGEEFANVALDCVLPTSPQKAYELFIHDSEFLKGFFTDDQGLKEVEIGEWESNGDGDLQKREMSYIKPLNGSIGEYLHTNFASKKRHTYPIFLPPPSGPKQTHCNIKDENEKVDPEKYISNITTTQTPDVPAGKDFSVRTKTVTTWSDEGGARVRVTTEVEWTKTNRMLKGIIERSCIDGQKKYHQDLEKAARAHIEANPDDFKDPGVTTTGASGGSKKGGDDSARASASEESESLFSSFLEQLTGPMGIVVGLVVILALTNLFTLNALRVQARAAHHARMGQPHEVASAVMRVLDQYKSVYATTGSKSSAEVEMKSLLKVVEDLEATAAGLVNRVKSVASML